MHVYSVNIILYLFLFIDHTESLRILLNLKTYESMIPVGSEYEAQVMLNSFHYLPLRNCLFIEVFILEKRNIVFSLNLF